MVIFTDFKVAYFRIEIVNFNENSDRNMNKKSNGNSNSKSRSYSLEVFPTEFKMNFQMFSEFKIFAY